MSGFADRLRLKEKAEEDLYFARHDRELLQARHERRPGDTAEVVRVRSSGETGVDRAALDSAMGLGLAVGGWCPAGRRAEDGTIPSRYPLRETGSRDPAVRTEQNVRDSDATLILHVGALTGGTRLTAQRARSLGRPLLIRDLDDPPSVAEIARWLEVNRVRVLNCAGPRESECPGITRRATPLLRELFAIWRDSDTHRGD